MDRDLKQPSPSSNLKTRKLKQADIIVAEMKRWIIDGKRPGDKMPLERDLITQFDSSRGTIREALRTLEVEGLVRIKTGPGGGAIVAEIPSQKAYEMLWNYLHFEGLDGSQIYQIRKLLEPELASCVAGSLSPEELAALARTVHASDEVWTDVDQIRNLRNAEIEFHNILARACTNPLLRVLCLFMNEMLKDLVVYKKGHVAAQQQYQHSNSDFHGRLLGALTCGDKELARETMLAHMIDCQNYMFKLDEVVCQNVLK